ncbi:MAG: PilZ domain-containing protein [Clostridiales bacterium]|nr:PilZ domain-containing protein [Clostridiales bacterium]
MAKKRGNKTMIERRQHKRLQLDVSIRLDPLDENGMNTSRYEHVDVTDISRSGLGFKSAKKLDKNLYYDTKIQIWTKEIVDAVIELIWEETLENGIYKYGAVFIGMSDTDAVKIDVYQIFNEK